jgi:hypothetical protein
MIFKQVIFSLMTITGALLIVSGFFFIDSRIALTLFVVGVLVMAGSIWLYPETSCCDYPECPA